MSSAAAGVAPLGSRLAVLLFTDLVGSTQFKSRFGATTYVHLLARHDELFKKLILTISHAEILQDTGDGYFAVFPNVTDAVRFALSFQAGMRDGPWESPEARLQTRIGIHVGEVALMPPEASGKTKMVGMATDLAARVMSLAQGGQILLTRVAFNEARQFIEHVPAAGEPPLKWVAHGNYLFKGQDEPVEVYEVGVEGLAPLTPPPDSEKARRSVSAEQEETLGWRPAVGLAVPQRVGWMLQKKLGEGMFGEVWLARSESTKQTRVFKFCFDVDRLRSFKRELTLFRLLRDALGERRDIATIYDVRLDHPPFFLEGEYAPSGSLANWSTGDALGKIPLVARLEIVAKVADAIAAAHSVGVLHKDIKPSNILMYVEPDGTLQPRLSDFGIGILTDQSQLAAHHITEIDFTLLGDNESSRTGTRMYAPPESLVGRPFTIQGDIFALGVLLYQMTIGSLERPVAPGWERDIEDVFIREDIGSCVDGDSQRRLSSAAELARRIRSIPQRKALREREMRTLAAHNLRGRMLRVAGLAALVCLLISIVSVIGYLREHALRTAIADSEALARQSELDAQRHRMKNQILAGDSLVQSKRYAEATSMYEEAWGLAERLSEPTMCAVSGLVQSRAESPTSLINRRATTRPDEPVSPLPRVRIAPSGKFLIAGDANGHAYVLDLPLLRRIAVLPVNGWGYGVAFAPDGKTCFIGGSRGELNAWAVDHWQKPRETGEKMPFIYALATSLDGRMLASVEPSIPTRSSGKLHLWSLNPLTKVHTLDASAGLLSVAFSPDGKALATGDEKGVITLWNVESGNVIATLEGHAAEVPSVAFTPDGQRILSGSYDRTVRLWDVAGRRELFRFMTHRGAVREVCISHDGKLGASASADETLKCWDLQSGKELTTFSRHPQGATSVEFLPDDSGIVSSGDNGRVAVWPLTNEDAPAYKLHAPGLAGVCLCPDGLTALSAGGDGKVRQFDLETGHVLRSVATPQRPVAVAVSPDQSVALVGGVDGMLQLLDLEDFTLRRIDLASNRSLVPLVPATGPTTAPTTLPTRGYMSAIAISSTASSALVGGWDNGVASIGLPGGGPAWAHSTDQRVLAACFSPDGKRALISIVRDLYLIDVTTGHVLKEIHTTSRPILAVAIAPDGKTAATGGYDHPIKLWDLDTGMNTNFMAGHLGPVRALAFMPDGKTLVSASEDNTVRLWDVVTPGEIRSFSGHTGGACAVSISRDGSLVLTIDRDGIVRKWDFGRPAAYRAFARDVENLYPPLDVNPEDAASLKRLGNWFAFRGRDEWAVACFEYARSGGATVSPLIEARCYWNMGRNDQALRALTLAKAQKQAPDDYLDLCAAAIKATSSSQRDSGGDRR